jgi:multidrug resistance protein MdtO
MARPAAEPLSRFAQVVWERLTPRPGRFEYALRVAVICALTALVVETYQTPSPALTVYIVFFLNKPDRVESLILNAVMVVLFTLIVGFTLLVTMGVVDTPLWRLAAMAALSFGLVFLASASKLRPIGGTVALVVAYALDLMGTVHLGEVATRGLLYVWLFIAIPAGVSAVVNLFGAPPPRRLVERALAERLELAAKMLQEPTDKAYGPFRECLRAGNTEINTWLKLAGAEKTSLPADLAALRQATDSSIAILAWTQVLLRERILPRSLCEHLANTLQKMAEVLNAGRYPIEIHLEEASRLARDPASAQALELWSGMQELLAHFAVTPPDASRATPSPGVEKSGFFLPDAFTSPQHTRYAFKTTAAALFCYVLYSLLDWQSIHTCLITCYIISLGTAAETVEKLALRILGCIVGAAFGYAAIVYVMPALSSIGALMGVVFAGTLAAAWVAAGSPRIAYAGFQVAFAFLLCVLQGPSPAFDLVVARDRVIGILLGNLVVYVLFTRLWPTSISHRIDAEITSVLRQLGKVLTASGSALRRSQTAQVQASLGALEQDLSLVQYEPVSLRPSQDWLRSRQGIAHEIGALSAPALLVTETDPGHAEHLAERLGALATGYEAQQPPSPATDQANPDSMPSGIQGVLRALMRRHHQRLEQALDRSARTASEENHALA